MWSGYNNAVPGGMVMGGFPVYSLGARVTDLNCSSMCEPLVGINSGWITCGVKSTSETLS